MWGSVFWPADFNEKNHLAQSEDEIAKICYLYSDSRQLRSPSNMLTKINKIKYLGLVFRDFTWAPGVAEFRQVNLFYGWNGCGKTTLTRLFDEVAPLSEAGIEFELEIADGTMFRRGDAFPHPIRVFNQDYIQKNVRILESRANTISVLLGEQNKELVAQIEANERELNGDQSDPANIGKIREFDGFTQKTLRKEKGNETAFSDIARTIGAAIVGSGSASRTYRSPDAKRDFETLRLPALLPDEALDARILALKQDPLPTLDLLQLPSLVVDGIALPFTEAVKPLGVILMRSLSCRLSVSSPSKANIFHLSSALTLSRISSSSNPIPIKSASSSSALQ